METFTVMLTCFETQLTASDAAPQNDQDPISIVLCDSITSLWLLHYKFMITVLQATIANYIYQSPNGPKKKWYV